MTKRKYKCKVCSKSFKSTTERNICDECNQATLEYARNLVIQPSDCIKNYKGIIAGQSSVIFRKSKPNDYRNSYS